MNRKLSIKFGVEPFNRKLIYRLHPNFMQTLNIIISGQGGVPALL